MSDDKPKTFSQVKAAEKIGVSSKTLKRYRESGKINNVPGTTRYAEKEIDRFVNGE